MTVLQTRSIGVEFDVEETLDKVESAGDASQLSLLKVGVDCFLEKIISRNLYANVKKIRQLKCSRKTWDTFVRGHLCKDTPG